MSKHWYDRYVGKSSKKDTHYSFWSDEFDFDASDYKSVLSEEQIDTMKKYRLSSARKAIGNFVTIATGKAIPTKFSNGKESYTDGKTVVLSGDIDKEEKFDIGVGLALHEGSHILLTDFEILKQLTQLIPAELVERAQKLKVDYHSTVKNILNVVEDRRIDNFIYTNAPGYREYYLKLYDEYFGGKVIAEALKSDEWTDETVESYMNRLINIMNPASDLTTLKGFRKIWNLLDLHNIGRLKSTKESLDVSIKIFEVILDNVKSAPFSKNDPKAQQGEAGESGEGEGEGQSNGEGESGGGEESGNSAGSPDIDVDGDEDDSSEGSSASASGSGKDGNGTQTDKEALSDSKKRKLTQTIQRQKDFLNGQTKKKKISGALQNEIDAVDNSGAELVRAGEGMKNRWGAPMKGCEVVVLKKLTLDMVDNGSIEIGSKKRSDGARSRTLSDNSVQTAERMGAVLGKKLQVRNEARTTVFNRQRNGSIDKRLIHSLGFDAESVFTQLHIDKFKKANIHLSIDASSSMGGSKWDKTLINAIALAKAVSMIQNLSMQISFRYTTTGSPALPVVLVAWDSRKDSFKKVQTIFPTLYPNGTTPEGLCFEAIQKLIVPASNDMDSYFVNISDGEPCYSNKGFEYQGESAHTHTKQQVERLRKDGLIVLSYFVSDRDNGGATTYAADCFRKMYGKDARFININSVNEVSTTLNKMFLAK